MNNHDNGLLLLIRHAERPPIPQNSFGNKLSITQKGKEDSFKYGKGISSKLHLVHSSPIKRCVEKEADKIFQ